MLAFGPPSYALYGGFLTDLTKVKAWPELTLYAIVWTVITATVWQCIASWRCVLVPTYIGTGKNLRAVLLVLPDVVYTDGTVHSAVCPKRSALQHD